MGKIEKQADPIESEEKMMTEDELNEKVEELIAEAMRRKEEKAKKAQEEAEKPKEEKKPVPQLEGRDFKIPSSIEKKVGKKKYKNYALVVYCRRNREVEMKYVPVENDIIRIGYLTFDARADCYYTYGEKRIPVMIIPEWSLRPFGTLEYQQAVKLGEVTDAQDITIKAAERMELESKKKKLSPVAIIIGVLVVAAIAYTIATRKGA